jgi:hypothetical protein
MILITTLRTTTTVIKQVVQHLTPNLLIVYNLEVLREMWTEVQIIFT